MVDKWGTAFAFRRNGRLTVRYSEALLTPSAHFCFVLQCQILCLLQRVNHTSA